MSAWETLWKILGEEFADLADFEQTARAALRLLLAAALGAVLGYEREQSGKAAGLRTHMLVTLGAALFVMPLQLQGGGADALSRVIRAPSPASASSAPAPSSRQVGKAGSGA